MIKLVDLNSMKLMNELHQINELKQVNNSQIDNYKLQMAITTKLSVVLMCTIALFISSTSAMQQTRNSHQQTPTPQPHLSHKFSPSVSNQLSTAIKNKIISNLSSFTDQQFAQQLVSDLNQDKDQNRKLKQISPQSAQQLFKIFGLKNMVCDKNGDGVIVKEQLQCLNYIWKYYVPEDI